MRDRPGIGFFFGRAGIDIGEGPVPFIIDPAGSRHFLVNEDAGDPGGSRAVYSQVKDLLHDPAGLLVNGKCVFDFWVPLIAEGRVGEGALSGGEFGVKGSFDLAAGILGEPLVEQILEGDEIGQALFGVLILSDSDIADLLFRENELQDSSPS